MTTTYQIEETDSSKFLVTGPENRGIEGDGYFLGYFRDRATATLFVRSLELADAGAPIGEGLPLPVPADSYYVDCEDCGQSHERRGSCPCECGGHGLDEPCPAGIS